MKKDNRRRSFLKALTMGGIGVAAAPASLLETGASVRQVQAGQPSTSEVPPTPQQPAAAAEGLASAGKRPYNTPYSGEYLNRVAFPIGGIGAGMFCLEGTGAISHLSVRNHPDIYDEPAVFAALSIRGLNNGVKVLEGPVPDRKYFGPAGTGLGAAGTTFGLPRYSHAEFTAAFPFGIIRLHDGDMPVDVELTGWSPFIPTDEDNSSLPVGALEYRFVNKGTTAIDAVFSYNAKNFMITADDARNSIRDVTGGYILRQDGTTDKPQLEGSFAVFSDDPATVVDHCWFRGGWWDPLTMAWNTVRGGKTRTMPPVDKDAPGASLFVPFSLAAGAAKTIRVLMAWYVPETTLKIGEVVMDEKKDCNPAAGCCAGPEDLGITNGKKSPSPYHKPWYSGRFSDIRAVTDYWRGSYAGLRQKTMLFMNAFHSSSLPAEVMEAVAANLTILKSPTVLRQYDGRFWNWEGCGDDEGSCHGSCTHVWNYAQAVSHLFPALERTLRHTEFCENQNKEGHQGFRANIPISPLKHDFHAAADGQLGGIMKVYREWRISGDNQWVRRIYPMVKKSMDYCIRCWDPRGKGVTEEPHHNTYDIEFWGPDGMCTSFYLGALRAITEIGAYLGEDVGRYRELYGKGRQYMESRLYDGEYFIQQIEYEGLDAPDPAKALSFGGEYSPEAVALLKQEGPKYQYGKGCLSDGVLGAWIGKMCGLEDFIDSQKITSHLTSVHRYNLRKDLHEHANPQRPGYALGHEGGLLLCTWPKGGRLSLPFVYSEEVWTGIEYQVASHLMGIGEVAKGLEIVRLCRDRYDGRVRNPFNEYECGHWYARAMSSYGLLQGLTGLRYDAVEKTLHIHSQIGDFTCFLSTATGFGTVSLRQGKAAVEVAYGEIMIDKIKINGNNA